MRRTEDEQVQIAGAGPAGLAAAITLATAGRQVVVHEAHRRVGHRFGGDLQGLENWTGERDALEALRDLGITTDFETLPCCEGQAFDPWGRAYPVRSERPLFYMVERGPGHTSLDSALLRQALAVGVEVRFGSRVRTLEGPAILATGPRIADAVATGYHFTTDMDDGFWIICDDRLAPRGYAYLLVMNGRGTVKTCLFDRLSDTRRYVERTVAAFERLVGLRMIDPRPHGGAGNFHIPVTALEGNNPVAGEQAGFQDTLWGFGIHLAIQSGVLAARCLLEGAAADYDRRWRQAFGPLLEASVVNRAVYSLLGNRGYRWGLRLQAKRDARLLLQRTYRPSRLKRRLFPLARWRYRSKRTTAPGAAPGCSSA